MTKPILYMAGPHGAGKTHAAKELAAYGFVCIDLGPTIRRLHQETGTALSLGEWIVQEEKRHGSTFTDDLLRREVEKVVHDNENKADVVGILVLGSRSLQNIKHLSSAFNQVARVQKTLYIEAPESLLKSRYENREGRPLTKQDFSSILKKDENMGLLGIKKTADHVIVNDKTEKEFSAMIRQTLIDMGYIRKNTPLPKHPQPKFRK